MSVNFYGNFSNSTQYNSNSTSKNISNKKALITASIIAGTGITAGLAFKGKAGQKVIETLNKKLPELETKAKNLWGKLTGSSKKAEEEILAQKRMEEAKRQAEERKQRLEAEYKARQNALQEAKKQQELKKAAATTRKIKEINNATENKILDSVAPLFDPIQAEKNKLSSFLENKIITPAEYSEQIKDAEKLKPSLYEVVKNLEKSKPDEVFDKIAAQLQKGQKQGGSDTVEDTIQVLEKIKNQIDSLRNSFEVEHTKSLDGIEDLKRIKQLNKYFNKNIAPLNNYSAYIDELLTELKASGNTGKSGSAVLRKSITTVEKNHEAARIAAIEARKVYYESIARNYQEQIAPIRERIHYDESYVPNPSCELTPEQRKATAEELNEIIRSGNSQSNIPADASAGRMQGAWKNKYLTMPFNMKNKDGETAILNTFPRYEAGKLKDHQGNIYHTVNTGDFKYEPVYRQMHIENPEEFVKQFENIGGVYEPGRRQSCAKTRYYGESWGTLELPRYGFVEWNPENNVKFVIHPKGPISNAAEIGEGKYGDLEVLYAADSKYKILGTVKKTVTPEEINQGMHSSNYNFDDFDKYEIHLQEM